MNERLRAPDLAILAAESPFAPLHNATVAILEPDASGEPAFDYASLLRLIDDRITYVPRYRQRIQFVPGRLANPVWVDDARFDLAYHVRRSALPRPGTLAQLRELVSRIISRPLDRERPLWEVYFVEGLEGADGTPGGRVAVLVKSHQLLVDGTTTVDLGQVLFDANPEIKPVVDEDWHPATRPTPAWLVLDAVADSFRSPATALSTARSNVEASLRRVGHVLSPAANPLVSVVSALASRPQVHTPVTRPLSQQRRFVAVSTSLDDHRRVRDRHGGSVNDVVLATVAGALRAWLMTRAESLSGLSYLQAVVPMSVIDKEQEGTQLGSQIAAHRVVLPIAEPNALVRLHQVTYSFEAHQASRRAVAASRLAGIAGFAPATFHALGSRVAAAELRRGFDVSITNVPGPQFPLYAAGAKLVETYPVPPLLADHALAIGVTSYDGRVFYAMTADRDALPDAEVLGQCVTEALDELLDTVRAPRGLPPRGRFHRARGEA